MCEDLTIEQICMHYGEDKSKNRGAVVTPIYQTSSYSLDSEYEYSRGPAPNFEVVEKKIAALDHAKGAIMVASGVAAINAVLHAVLKAGDHVVCVDSCYVNARRAFNNIERFGITHTRVTGKSIEEFEAAIKPNTKLIYLESPSSFVCELQPIEEIVKLAKSKGILTSIDNTCGTPLYQNPIDMGVDFVIYSASKYFGGHADLIGGFVVCNDDKWMDILQAQRIYYGWVSTPFNAFLVERGFRTLPARMNVISANSKAVAEYLDGHKNIKKVFHPVASTYDQKDLFNKQMRGFGGIFSFQAKNGTRENYAKFISSCRIFQNAVSWGGHESLVYSIGVTDAADPSIFSEKSIEGGVLRIYTGLENTNDLLNDLEQALKVFD